MSNVDVSELLKSIQNVDKTKISNAERQKLVLASQELLAKVETPWEAITRLVWITPALQASLKTFVDLGLFEKWSAAGAGIKTAEELGTMASCEPYLLERLMRNLTAAGLASNPGPHQYEMNDFSKSLAEPMQQAGIRYMYDINIPAYTALPQYLACQSYKTPQGTPSQTAFNWGRNYIGKLFDYFSERPKSFEDFNLCMKGYAGSFTPWTEIYPTDKLVEGGDDKDVVVVDVGGNVGHDIAEFQRKHKLPSGRLVLQDQPQVIEQVQIDSSIKVTPHDFFTPQPVKGARAYYLHSVLHDWPDDMARKILSNLKPAMERGKSKVLIHELVMFPQGNAASAAHSDLLMMTLGNAKERSVEMWKELVEPAGFKVVQVHSVPTSPQGVIELELA